LSKAAPLTRAAAHTLAQRERILTAARSCFVDSGFHAASMASIAETAGMSAGLIYRYFENKYAIILAIIDQQLTLARERIRDLHSFTELSQGIVDYFDEPEDERDDSMSTALYLEISAQAMRDPQIAEALRKYDLAVCAELADWFSRGNEEGGGGLPQDIAPTRALMLQCLIEGLIVRSARAPALDNALLRKTLNGILDLLVSPVD